ncbi:MAG: aminotransferase class I/II-fold pyridoxal phosphate-dependent enzyme, partial [Thermoanaerobaculia bacterium]|nr:aminotransferase class I/II-fold pyridoxal phosphate-dependent enzyme [Thermoanaerobaculia bacterium]
MASEPLRQGLGRQARRDIALYDKCRRYTLARETQAKGLYPYFREISRSEDTEVTMEGRRRLMLGSNNYLGLAHHPRILEAASRALVTYGSGCTGSRLLNGTLDLHLRLEAELADFVGKEDCLVFPTGYSANLGLISGLAQRGDTVYLDKFDHASIVDGARLSLAETVRFRHGDVEALDRALHERGGGSLVICDGVYSMDGVILDVPRMVEVTRRHGAALAVDDAHALGVLGPGGEGTPA